MNKTRYSFWRVFWIVLAIYIFLGIMGFVVLSLASLPTKNFSWDKIKTQHYFLSQVMSFLFSSVFYYFTLNWFYHLIANKKPFVDYIKPFVITIIGFGFYYSLSYYLFSYNKIGMVVNDTEVEKLPLSLMIFSYVVSALFSLGVSLLIAYLTYLRDEKKQRKVLEEQKMQLEVEKSQANFNFLKAQINPHFLHNTLNFLYAKSLPYSTELSEGILTLSDIMRYALSPSATKDGKVMLKEEIEHVRNVIKINQLRFSNNLNVQFDVNGVLNGATIIPFILITLVENAFKHGDLKSPQYPIAIKLDVNADRLYFYCRNKKKTGSKEISTGIGLDNIKKQLDLTYGNGYALNVKDEAEFYTSELTINPV